MSGGPLSPGSMYRPSNRFIRYVPWRSVYLHRRLYTRNVCTAFWAQSSNISIAGQECCRYFPASSVGFCNYPALHFTSRGFIKDASSTEHVYIYIYIYIYINSMVWVRERTTLTIYIFEARGNVVVKALYYKPEGRGLRRVPDRMRLMNFFRFT
jgi:hypothetical protein